MLDINNSLVTGARKIRDAQAAYEAWRALRAYLYDFELGETEQTAINWAKEFLQGVLRAATATTPEAREATVTLVTDVRSLKQARDSAPDPSFIDVEELNKLLDALKSILEGKEAPKEIIQNAVRFFDKMNGAALEGYRAQRESRLKRRVEFS